MEVGARKGGIKLAALDTVVSELEGRAADAVTFSAFQLAVCYRGALIVNEARGMAFDGTLLSPNHLHNVFCLGKPLAALAVGHLIDQGNVSLTSPLQNWVMEARREITLGDVLNHSAGLRHPLALSWRLTTPDARPALAERAWTQSPAAAYSEVLGWVALERVLERETGLSAASAIETLVTCPLKVNGGIIFEAGDLDATTTNRINVPVGGLPERNIPMLSERAPHQLGEIRPALGLLATCLDLATAYDAVRRGLLGEQLAGIPRPSTLRDMFNTKRGKRYDETLKRECDFAGGFMINMASHGVSEKLSVDSFGHTAGLTNAVVVSDQRSEITIALYLNGFCPGAEQYRAQQSEVIGSVLSASLPL